MGPGGRIPEKDLPHPMWSQNTDTSDDSSSDEDTEISRIEGHVENSNGAAYLDVGLVLSMISLCTGKEHVAPKKSIATTNNSCFRKASLKLPTANLSLAAWTHSIVANVPLIG